MDRWLMLIFEELRHATKLKSINFTCNYRKRNGRHNKKSNMADDPYLDCTVGQDSAVMNENPLYFITNIEEDDDTHVWTDRKLVINGKVILIALRLLVPVYLYFTCMLCFYVESDVDIDIISMILITKENPISDLVDYIWITEGLTVNTTIPFITCCVLSYDFSSCTQNDRRCSENVKYF